MLAARFLGVQDFGIFSGVNAIVGILSKFVDFGIEPIVFREFSKDKENFHLFSSALSLRFVLFFILVIVFNIVAPFLKYSFNEILLTNILFTTVVLSMKTINVRDLLATPFKVNLKMHYPMTLAILDNVILLAMVFYIPFTKSALIYFAVAYSISNLPGFVLSFHYLKKKLGYKFKATLHRSIWLLKESLPLFGFAILTTIFMQIDIVLLYYYKDASAAGIYSAGIRLTMPLNIIPGAIVTTVFPILVKRMSDQAGSDFLSNMVVKLLYFIAFVIAAVFTFEASALSRLVFGSEFEQTAVPLSVLSWCQIFLFFTHYTLAVLVAKNRQVYNFTCGAIQVVVNLAFNFLLIPKYSYLGAAYAKLFASFASFVFLVFVLNKFGYRPSIGRYKVLLWSISMCFGFYALSLLPVVPYLILSPLMIGLITFGLRFFNKEELITFFRLLNREELGKRVIDKYKLA